MDCPIADEACGFCRAGILKSRLMAFTQVQIANAAALLSDCTNTRLQSSILKLLYVCGIAGFNSASAAERKASSPICAPRNAFSAAEALHGLVATPPSAIRQSLILSPSKSRATAAEDSENSKLARSRALK